MGRYDIWKKKHKVLSALIKIIYYRNNRQFMDLVLYGEEGVIYRNLGKCPLQNQKKVLICYLTNGQDAQDLKDVMHTNVEEKYIIIQCFSDYGFQVDLCDCRNIGTISTLCLNTYDVIFGFGPAYQWACRNWESAFRIEYFTESPYWYSKKKEQERIDYYNSRTGKCKKLYRTGLFYKENDENNADAIICMCEESYFKRTDIPIYKICPHGLYNDNYKLENINKKDTKSFLFFGTAGYIHKGLDVAIEAFKKIPDLKLYVCGGMETYLGENDKLTDNIVDCGNINVQSAKYLELVEKCRFVLLPSCSEASPSGIITCMRHGVIPIVSKGLGLDFLEEYCFFLDDYRIDYLWRRLENISNISDVELDYKSQKVFGYAKENFTLEAFAKEFDRCLNDILIRIGD